jgi:hypothetical protein
MQTMYETKNGDGQCADVYRGQESQQHARKTPVVTVDTTTETTMAFVAAATTKKTTNRRPVSTTSATDPTYKLRITTCNRLDRTAECKMRIKDDGMAFLSCWPVLVACSDSPTRRGENGAGTPPLLVHATRSHAGFSHASCSHGASAHAFAHERPPQYRRADVGGAKARLYRLEVMWQACSVGGQGTSRAWATWAVPRTRARGRKGRAGRPGRRLHGHECGGRASWRRPSMGGGCVVVHDGGFVDARARYRERGKGLARAGVYRGAGSRALRRR